jgi:hypothetical protein
MGQSDKFGTGSDDGQKKCFHIGIFFQKPLEKKKEFAIFACNIGKVYLKTNHLFMTAQELHAKIQSTKGFLNREIVRNRTNSGENLLSFREIGVRMDMLHEAERVGVRNLGERQNRKLTRMILQLEEMTETATAAN